MNRVVVSRCLGISSEGPVSAENGELIHLRQGDLDGGCGPYCLGMALIASGIITRHEAQNLGQLDGRTRGGRFRDALLAFGALIANGTNNDDLVWLAEFFKTKGLNARNVSNTKRVVFEDVITSIDTGALPVIKVLWEGGGRHWLLAVGYQGIELDNQIQLTHLLCLDPGEGAPKTSFWNSILNVFNPDGSPALKGRLTSLHWGMSGLEHKCQIEGAVILEK